MGALIGFILGYIVGAKAGPEGYDEVVRSIRTLMESEEWKGLVATATGFLGNTLAQGGDAVAEQLRSSSEDLAKTFSKIMDSEELQRLIATGTALLGSVLARGSEARY